MAPYESTNVFVSVIKQVMLEQFKEWFRSQLSNPLTFFCSGEQ